LVKKWSKLDLVKIRFWPEEANIKFSAYELKFVSSDPITGKSAGSGFVTFSDCDAGKTAHKELDRFDLGGKRIRVSGTALPLFFINF
jgi:hypothetical protein